MTATPRPPLPGFPGRLPNPLSDPLFFRLFGRGAKSKVLGILLSLAVGAFGVVLLPGKVISVADGDTLTVMASGGSTDKIRLYGIDSPELKQEGGEEAAEFLRSLAFLSPVKVERIDKDRYGRSVAVVTLEDGRVLNEELLKNGQAWLYDQVCKSPRCFAWKGLEAQAKSRKLGIWKAEKPIAPWKWRKSKR